MKKVKKREKNFVRKKNLKRKTYESEKKYCEVTFDINIL